MWSRLLFLVLLAKVFALLMKIYRLWEVRVCKSMYSLVIALKRTWKLLKEVLFFAYSFARTLQSSALF